jgi:SnoaL-like domain
VTPMDWSRWAIGLEKALGPEGDFASLFAPGALFSDPVNEPTADLAAIEEMTNASFPDWRQELTAVHGDSTGGAFEWIGRGTLGGTIPIEIHGCTAVDVDDEGLVTRWRDYFDLKEIEEQVAATTQTAG